MNSLPAFARRQQNGFAGVGIGFGLRLSVADKLSLSSQSEKTICAYRPQCLHPRRHEICNARVADNLLQSHRF